jgi:hypothetical protein
MPGVAGVVAAADVAAAGVAGVVPVPAAGAARAGVAAAGVAGAAAGVAGAATVGAAAEPVALAPAFAVAGVLVPPPTLSDPVFEVVTDWAANVPTTNISTATDNGTAISLRIEYPLMGKRYGGQKGPGEECRCL